MSFMEPDVYACWGWRVETTAGTYFIPGDVEPSQDKLGDYVEGTIQAPEDIEKVDGWFGRMSAPGYLDCTDWYFGKSEAEVLDQLRDYYGLEDESSGCEECDDLELHHVDYPHAPGYLDGCEACEDHCHCSVNGKRLAGQAACVFEDCTDDESEA